MERDVLTEPAQERAPAAGLLPAQRVSPEDPDGQLEIIDAELRRLLPALTRCAHGRVYALHPVHRLRFLALLPFHLHVWWPDELKWWA